MWIKIGNSNIKLKEVFMFEVDNKIKTVKVFFKDLNITKVIENVSTRDRNRVKKLDPSV